MREHLVQTDSPMLIICPTCASEYTLDPEKIGASGRRVRCIQCQTIWLAQPPPVNAQDNAKDIDWSEPAPVSRPDADQFAFVPVPDAASITDAAWADAARDEPDVAAALANEVHEPDNSGEAVPNPDAHADIAVVASAPVAIKSRKRKPGGDERPEGRSSWFMRPLSALVSPAAITVLGLGIIGFGIVQRNAVVKMAPALGPVFEMAGLPANIRGLIFQNVTSETVTTGADRFLVIEGTIAGARNDRVPVPQIELVVRDASAKPVYTWTVEPPRPSLIPGDTMRFRARLASPPENGHDVMVRFASAPAPDKPGTKTGEKAASGEKSALDKTASSKTAMHSAPKP